MAHGQGLRSPPPTVTVLTPKTPPFRARRHSEAIGDALEARAQFDGPIRSTR